ncbi:hypothetical protein [Streptomyces sp. NPDC000410]|uniref:hypothetical protein n=1 Tax=Streptomyces sp. NPDC000410 TaxID=3154254 RepID=UPI0033202C20
MIRLTRLAALPLLLVLAACGTERAGDPAPDRAALEARARGIESAPELIYATEVDGFELAKQSVGPSGSRGFQSTYVSRSGGGQIHLVVDAGSLTEANCPSQAVDASSAAKVTCERDGKGWYRTTSSRHEYARDEGGHVVRIAADRAVDRDTLRRAAEAAHRADDRELDEILPEKQAAPPSPVERGDLPPAGDGAPRNDYNAGG